MSERSDSVAKLLDLSSLRPLWSVFAASALALVIPTAAQGQALPAATREPLQVGAAFSFGTPDYTIDFIQGFTLFAEAGLRRRLGIEADVHLVSYITPQDVGENSYLIGPRYTVYKRERLNAYVKVMGGIGRFQFQPGRYSNPYTANYSVIAGGAGLEYRATRHINVRVIDVSVQRWLSFPPNGLTPTIYSIGAAYVP